MQDQRTAARADDEENANNRTRLTLQSRAEPT